MVNYKRLAIFVCTVILTLGLITFTTPNILRELRLGLDLKGGFEVLYEASPLQAGGIITTEALKQTARSLEKRINALGTSEPEIWTEGTNRIRIRLAGVEDESTVRELLKKPAELTVKGPDGAIELYGDEFKEGAARVVYDQAQRPMIRIEVKDKQKLKDISTRLLNKPIFIYLDDVLLTSPVIGIVLTEGVSTITGNFRPETAKELADTINLGALPLKLTEKYTQSVGASLGQLSLEQTVFAGVTGSLLILLFMIALYRMAGIVASITLITYTWTLLLVTNWMHATLTLPGIAAFVLGIGMAVDANIITYERYKEERSRGLDLLSALEAGSKHSFRTIMDSNVTTAIAAGVLFYVGTGAIRGFAVTLLISILLSILTNMYFSHWLLRVLMQSRLLRRTEAFAVERYRIWSFRPVQSLAAPVRAFDFVSKRKLFYAISIAVTVLGAGSLLVQGFNLGVDFKAGTTLDLSLPQSITKQQAEALALSAGFEPSTITVGGDNGNRVSMRFDKILDPNTGESSRIIDAFVGVYGPDIAKEENTVDPGIARELALKAIIAVAIASIGILLYVSIRFEWLFALAAIFALMHDAFFVISFFSLFRLEVNLTFIAALLTIIGYSINDTVVIFDRIRENLALRKPRTEAEYVHVVNSSINQTLTRSIHTVIAVLFASAALLVWGSEAIRLFSLAMTLGLAAGMYSSIYIASQLWLTMKLRKLRKSPTPPPIPEGLAPGPSCPL
ncbi:SecD/SecF fusion protein [Paenibacillus sp. UNCCL117]|uniref:protein translocase subunit SecDF n=1 Tax=unclassified Paenibacillus TaxID=185978 RepID=UPI00088DCFFE|nr:MULTISPECIES: protein translocase subunit SecDF [unclassified Paenibacillus]SDE47109.1 protein translocase subunit secF /protein translocase subunit secD [Paenibacillus sp. cl123]SFW65746.1 SecD/SecF fusion protein [Paenibacillus sp. UNCCL117]